MNKLEGSAVSCCNMKFVIMSTLKPKVHFYLLFCFGWILGKWHFWSQPMEKWSVIVSPFDGWKNQGSGSWAAELWLEPLCPDSYHSLVPPGHGLCCLHSLGCPSYSPFAISTAVWMCEVSGISLLPSLPSLKACDCIRITFKLPGLHTSSPLSSFLLPPRPP